MAICKIPFSVLTLIFISIFPFISSLSTIAISETANQTLICATIQSPNQSPYLNCTTFPDQNQTPLSLSNTSVSGIVGGNGFLCSISSPSSATSSNNVSMGIWRFSLNGTKTISYTYKRIYRGPPLKELKAGDSHICGLIRGTGDLVCWQWRRLDTSMHRNIFKKISVGGEFICGLSEFGNIKCLQDENETNNGSIVRYMPSGNYSVIGAGFCHACAISVNGSLICWGENVGEYPQGYEFTTLALGDNRSCAIRANGTVVCWGEGNFSLPLNLKNTYFVAIEAKGRVFCGIVSSNYSLYCWGNEFLETNPRVFDYVVPGACVSACPCSHPLPGYSSYCSGDMMICEPCISQTPQVVPPVVQAAPPQSPAKSGGWSNRMVVFLLVGCVGCTSLVIVGCFLFFKYCKYRKCQVHDSGPLDEEGRLTPIPVIQKRPSKLLSINSACGHLEEFSLQVLNQHTNNFSDDHKVGTGSFGSVYRATLDDGRQVAIKRAEASSSSSQAHDDNKEDKDSAFMNELEFLSRLNHKNLVRLLGYCRDSDERILVYEYMCKGTLNDNLHKTASNNGSSPLTVSWAERLKIALDAARGIEYLHVYANPPIIHRDIKSSNILLDAMWTAKVSDFGLSLIGPRDEDLHLSIPAAGTMGYLDPEYYRTQQLTTKSDVYSFGVVLLELLTGRKAIHNNENGVPRNVIDFVAPYIAQDEIHRALDRNVPPPTPFEIEGVAYVGYLAANCVALQGRDRPTMTKVVHSLERALAACLAPPQILSQSSTESST